jgi:hypothetical protein
MRKKPIAVVINFCTNESRFLKACIEQARLFAQQIIVCVCDHFFDGTPEDETKLDLIYRSFPDCTFVQYPYIPNRISPRLFQKISPAHFWHSLSRLISVHYLDPVIETVLFLDADEIADGKKFAEWLDNSDYHQHVVLRLANYWYFREPRYQALTWEDSVVLVHRRTLHSRLLLHEKERDAIYEFLPSPKRRAVTSCDGKPMFHHFSWVRTKEEMLKKVRSWGHRNDQPWESHVETEFSGPFSGVDFVHKYQYKTVIPPFAIQLDPVQFEPILSQVVSLKKVSAAQVLKFLRSQNRPLWDKFCKLFSVNCKKA